MEINFGIYSVGWILSARLQQAINVRWLGSGIWRVTDSLVRTDEIQCLGL